jgi:hypothetical protein
MGSGKRLHLFTTSDKLKEIQHTEEIGNHAAGRKYCIPDSCVREWRNKDKLLASSRNR